MTRSFSQMVGRGAQTGLSNGKRRMRFSPNGALHSTVAQTGTPEFLAFSPAMDLPLTASNTIHVTLSDDATFNDPTLTSTGDWKIYIRQDATGRRALTMGSKFRNIYNTDIDPTPNSITLMTLVGRGNGIFDYTLTAVEA